MLTIFGSNDHLMTVYPVYFVLWPVAILFGCHGKTFKQEICEAPAGKEDPVELV